MRVRTITVLVCGLAAVAWAATADAQNDNRSSGGLVAVLDVAKVFEENARFNSRLEDIKREAEAFKARIEAKQQQLRTQADNLMKTYNPGSEEFKAEERRLEQEQAEIRTEARQTNNDLLSRESQIYFDTYSEMHSVVAQLAEQYGITLVLRFDSATIDPSDRGQVIKGVNRTVVYQRNLDLTPMVIEKMTTVAGTPQNYK